MGKLFYNRQWARLSLTLQLTIQHSSWGGQREIQNQRLDHMTKGRDNNKLTLPASVAETRLNLPWFHSSVAPLSPSNPIFSKVWPGQLVRIRVAPHRLLWRHLWSCRFSWEPARVYSSLERLVCDSAGILCSKDCLYPRTITVSLPMSSAITWIRRAAGDRWRDCLSDLHSLSRLRGRSRSCPRTRSSSSSMSVSAFPLDAFCVSRDCSGESLGGSKWWDAERPPANVKVPGACDETTCFLEVQVVLRARDVVLWPKDCPLV